MLILVYIVLKIENSITSGIIIFQLKTYISQFHIEWCSQNGFKTYIGFSDTLLQLGH